MKKEVKVKNKQLRKWEYLSEQQCIVCKKPFVTIHYWCYGGRNLNFDHWIIGSVYCSTKCSRIGHKNLRELD